VSKDTRHQALVVRAVEYGDADTIVTLVTETHGKLSAIVRGARKGSRRVGGALEPVHTIEVLLDDKGGELATLKESRIVKLRSTLVASLERLETAGTALRWARHLLPPRTAEPEAWGVLVDLLDALDDATRAPRTELAGAGLRLLAAVGYALDLERCVVCGKPCPEGKLAMIDPVRGGLVCRACGGASRRVDPALRVAGRAMQRGERPALGDAEAEALLEIVDRAMAAHAGFER
jgi:DNA repair protein RecO (recombination protein O)